MAERDHGRPLECWKRFGMETSTKQSPLVTGHRNGNASQRGSPMMMLISATGHQRILRSLLMLLLQPVLAPVCCSWHGIDRSFNRFSKGSLHILIYNFITTTFDFQGRGNSDRFALAGVATDRN